MGGANVSHVNIPLRVGMQVNIRSLETLGQPYHTTRVEDITDEYVFLQRPTHNFEPVRFSRGMRVELAMTVTQPTAVSGRYRTETTVSGVLWKPLPLLRLQLPSQWERSQLREFFRVPVDLPVRARTLPAEDKGGWFTARARDLSGGGCQLVLPTMLAEGQLIEMDLTLPEAVLRLQGRIQRIDRDPHMGGEHIIAGIKFVDIEEKQREQLIRYGFERQIELRKKGMT